MKITASKRDDILRDKQKYEDDLANYNKIHDAGWENFKQAQENAFQPSIEAIKVALGEDAEGLDIQMGQRFGSISVEIKNSDGFSRKEDSASLTWTWSAILGGDGEVKKESSSWSGLNATTPDQIEDLKKCVRQLEIINNLDWYKILNVKMPEYTDYVPQDLVRPTTDRNFDQELREAELEDGVGGRVLFLGNGIGKYYRGDVYFGILRESPSQYTVFEIPGHLVSYVLNNGSATYGPNKFNSIDELIDRFSGSSYRIKKSRFLDGLYSPIKSVQY